jgi:hypothetical protein
MLPGTSLCHLRQGLTIQNGNAGPSSPTDIRSTAYCLFFGRKLLLTEGTLELTFGTGVFPMLDYGPHGRDPSARSNANQWGILVSGKLEEAFLYSDWQRVASSNIYIRMHVSGD